MPKDIDAVVDSFREGINPIHFIGNPKIPMRLEDYATEGIRAESPGFSQPHPVHFNSEFTPYGIVIKALRRSSMLNAAVLGFREYNGAVDCLQIQGGPGRYKELTPIRWDSALLSSAIALAKKSAADAILLVPSFLVEGVEERNVHERAISRYDQNARLHGFEYSDLQQRWVLEIRK